MIQGKIWGNTQAIIQTPMIEFHRIWIHPNMQCSMHMHRHKWNAFYVVAGQLDIIVQKNDYDLMDTTVLGAGDFTTVPPGEYHMFRSIAGFVEAFELYYPEGLSEDIVRQSVGGVADE
jgi:mannose-6-phosphate isomerase-like protein (cupin superfamily)